LVAFFIELFEFLDRNVSELGGKEQKVLGFDEGRLCDVQKAAIFPTVDSLRAFNDVRRCGQRGSAELGRESVFFVGGKTTSDHVDALRECVTPLPDDQLAISLHRRSVFENAREFHRVIEKRRCVGEGRGNVGTAGR
jgi:hypothetical protein